MKLLSIGNSFSQDAQRYLYLLAREAEIPLKTFNLFIGGCPLSRHYRNMISEAPAYGLEINGEATGLTVSIKDALLSDDWDFVTLQQLSSAAPDYVTYQPYLDELAAYVRKLCPKTKLVIHQTWAYEEESRRLTEELGYREPEEMLANLRTAYRSAADAISAFGILPAGEAMLKARRSGVSKVHRDTFHAALGVGRLLLAEVWLTALSGRDLRAVSVPRTDLPVTPDELAIIREVAYGCVRDYGWQVK